MEGSVGTVALPKGSKGTLWWGVGGEEREEGGDMEEPEKVGVFGEEEEDGEVGELRDVGG